MGFSGGIRSFKKRNGRQEVKEPILFSHLMEPPLSDPIRTHRFPLLRHCERSRPSERVWQSLFTTPRLRSLFRSKRGISGFASASPRNHFVPRKDNLFNALYPQRACGSSLRTMPFGLDREYNGGAAWLPDGPGVWPGQAGLHWLRVSLRRERARSHEG